MKALVTGGGGFLGLAIVRMLVARGDSARSFSRGEHPELQKLGVEQHRGDLSDEAAVSEAAKGCDVIFHVAAKAGMWGPYEDYYRINVLGTENMLKACQTHSIQKLVYTSSPSVVFNGQDMEGVDESVPYATHFDANYPRTKALAEQLVLRAKSEKLATVALRPHLIWGPGDNHLLPRLIERARAGQLRRIGSVEKLIDTIYVDNAAEAHLQASDRLEIGSKISGKAYFISQGDPIETWRMINLLLKAAGTPEVTRSVPKSVALALANIFETIHRLTGKTGEPRLTRFVVKEMCTAHWFNIDAARREIGYQPRVSIGEGLKLLAASMTLKSG